MLKRLASWSLAVTFVGGGFFGAYLVWSFLGSHGARALVVALFLVVGGGFAAALGRSAIMRSRGRFASLAALLVVLACVVVYPVSWMVGGITAARFGITVWGILPIPALDITVDVEGRLRFREKSHDITRDEVERLAVSGAEIVVVGVGWHSFARVQPIRAELGIEMIVRDTRSAFVEYNRLRSEGRRVALLAHTTC